MKEQAYFYCYSYNLKNFLKLQGIFYTHQYKHTNGNRYWVYKSSSQLNKALTKWDIYKKTFPKGE